MPTEQENFKNSVNSIIEAVMFENWIRFYFIQEMKEEDAPEDKDPVLFVIIPDKAMHNIKVLYPELSVLAEDMHNHQITFEISQQVVCTYIVEHLDGHVMPRDTAGSVMDSVLFKTELQLFNTWIQLHEDQLEQTFLDFGNWQKLFSSWKESPAGKELSEKIMLSMQTAHQVPFSE